MKPTSQLKSAEPLEGDALRSRLRTLADYGGRLGLDDDTGHVTGLAPSMARAVSIGDEEIKRLCAARGMEWSDDFAGRARSYFASDERVDDYGDIVRQDWDFGVFEKNSPFLAQHSWYSTPIGRCLDWQVVQRSETDYQGPALVLTCLFAPGDEEAERIFSLVDRGFMPSGSVGFKSRRVIDVKDEDERQQLGLGKWGVILERNLLQEFSAVTLPANPGAVVRSLSERMSEVTRLDVDAIRECARRHICKTTRSKAEFLLWEQALLRVARQVDPKGDIEAHRELDAPIGLAAIERRQAQPVRVDDNGLGEKIERMTAALEEASAVGAREAMERDERKTAELSATIKRLRARLN